MGAFLNFEIRFVCMSIQFSCCGKSHLLRSRERVESGLTAHFLKGGSDVGVNEGDRVIEVLASSD